MINTHFIHTENEFTLLRVRTLKILTLLLECIVLFLTVTIFRCNGDS